MKGQHEMSYYYYLRFCTAMSYYTFE